MPAKKGTSADFQLFGRTNAWCVAALFQSPAERPALAQLQRAVAGKARRSPSLTSGMRRTTGATHSGASTSISLRASAREQRLRHQRVADPVRRDDEDAGQLMPFTGAPL